MKELRDPTGRVSGSLIESENSDNPMYGRCSLCGQPFYYEQEWESHDCLEDMDEDILKFALEIQKNFNTHESDRGDWKEKNPGINDLLMRLLEELIEYLKTDDSDEMADVGAFACWIFADKDWKKDPEINDLLMRLLEELIEYLTDEMADVGDEKQYQEAKDLEVLDDIFGERIFHEKTMDGEVTIWEGIENGIWVYVRGKGLKHLSISKFKGIYGK